MGCSDDLLETAELPVDSADQSFQWTRAEDVETRAQFRRNFGVGYSYDAVRGTFCNWQDIRCQVVNRVRVSELQDATGEQMLVNWPANQSKLKSEFNYSKRDYVAAVHLDTEEEIDLGLYSKTKRQRQDFIEDGVQEKFFYTLDEEHVLRDSRISEAAILGMYRRGYTNLLTLSFRNAVNHLAESDIDDIAAVDSFINVWGTHVITRTLLGGKLRIDLMNDMWRFNDKAKEGEWTTEEFLGAVAGKDTNRISTKTQFQWIEHSRLNLTAMGGDQSTLTGILGEHAPDGTRTFSTEGISKWRLSLQDNLDDEIHSNLEMVDMRVVPIWDFAEVINPLVARRIKSAVLQDVALQQSLLGNRNFFDSKLPLRYSKAQCQYQASTGRWKTFTRNDSRDLPMMVNVMSGGRYVAVVCHEQLEDMDLWVCYPIYEGKVNMACGLGVDANDFAYKVCWLNGTVKVTPTGQQASDGLFYINAGEVCVKPQDFVSYPESKALPAVEVGGGVTPDGDYDIKHIINVYRNDDDFMMAIPEGESSNFVLDCWKYVMWYNSKDVYQRTSDYIYIYNPNEVK